MFEGEAQRLTVRAASGDITILPGHISYSAAIKEGEGIFLSNERENSFFCGEGVLYVSQDHVRLMVCDYKKIENNQP